MNMTVAEKILARASGNERVAAHQTVAANVDLALSHENADLVRKAFLELGDGRVWDPSKVAIVFGHGAPAESALREFATAQGICDAGRGGVCHQVLPENGHVRPGMVVAGTDFHSTTHGAFGAFATGIGAAEMAAVWAEGKLRLLVPSTLRIEVEGEFRPWICAKDLILRVIGMLGVGGADGRAVEFDGPAIRRMTVASRMVLCNLATEIGAKAAFTPVDEALLDYLRPRMSGALEAISPDPGAAYERIIELDAGEDLWEPQIACPHAAGRVQPLSVLGDVPVHQAVLGCCTNGRLEDLAIAARVVEGRAVHPRTRLVVIPASRQVYLDAMRLGYLETLVSAGAVIDPPGCGSCASAHQSVSAAGETCVSSTNRHSGSQIFLASPAVVAASAIAGKLTHPESVVQETEPDLMEV
jgi:homoaconitate hydratase family protein